MESKTMKNWMSKLVLAALAAWMPAAAHALILTTWELPSNAKSQEEELAASTNLVTVLELNRSAKGDAVTMLFRNPEGKLAALSLGEDEFMARFSLVKGARGGARRGAAAQVVASDETENYKDGDGFLPWVEGEAKGSGWKGPWRVMEGENVQATFIEGDFSLETDNGTGTAIVGRALETPVESGKMEVRAWNDMGFDFVGFAVYDPSEKELLRWGVGEDEPGNLHSAKGFVYSLDGGSTYAILDEESPPGYVNYSLTWEKMGSDLSFTLEAWDYDGVAYPFDPPTFSVSAASVASIGVISTGDKRIAFDDLKVYGTPTAVPEPGTAGLLAAGLALLAGRRRGRRG